MIKLNLIAFSVVLVFLIAGCGKKETVTSENKTPEAKTEQAKTENVTTTADKNIQTVEFKCKGMMCSSCENKISSEVKKLDGVKEVIADSKTKTAKVIYAAGKISEKDIESVINKAGYDTETSKSDNPHDCSKESKEECRDKSSDCCKDKKTKKKI